MFFLHPKIYGMIVLNYVLRHILRHIIRPIFGNVHKHKVYMKNRFDIAKVKTGGIILVVREYLVKYVDVITSDCKYVFWFKLSKKFVNLFPIYC